MAVSQLILFFDGVSFRAEMPGPAGARRKINLPTSFPKRNPELLDLLRTDLARIKADETKIAALREAEQLRQRTNVPDDRAERQAHLDRTAAKRQLWLDSLPRDQREAELAKIDRKLQYAADQANARARGLYYYIVKNHTLQLANRVIADPKRRPKRVTIEMADGRLIQGIRATATYSPQRETIMTGKRKTELTLADMAKAIDLD